LELQIKLCRREVEKIQESEKGRKTKEVRERSGGEEVGILKKGEREWRS